MRLLIVVATAVVILVLVQVIRVVRLLPPEQRRHHLPRVLAAYAKAAVVRPVALPNTESAFAPPEGTIPVAAWESIEEARDLVIDARRVTAEGDFADVFDVDVDGTALVHRQGPRSRGYELWLTARDGSNTAVARGGAHGSGEALSGSVEHGVVAWLRDDPEAHQVEVWRWDAEHGARVLHRLAYPATGNRGAINGWVLVAADVTVATMLPGDVGTIVAHHPHHGVIHVASTSFVTLHRDVAAEERGLHRAAVCLHVANEPMGVVAELDLDVWPPRLTALGRGPFPGASTQLGAITGFWPGSRVLEIPHEQGIIFERGTVTDPIGNGRWLAFGYFVAAGRGTKIPTQLGVLFDAEGGKRMTLTEQAFGRMLLRGRFVAWRETTPHRVDDWDWTYTGASAWVAELATPPPGEAMPANVVA